MHKPVLACLELKYSALPPVSSTWLISAASSPLKHFIFARKIKNADKSISSISQDIAATGVVLYQLGNEPKSSDQTQLCSKEFVLTAQTLVNECNSIFAELDEALDDKKTTTPCHSIIRSWREKARYPFLEPRIELLRTNLERLESSLIVMMNVLIFAEQLSSKMTLPKALDDQRELLRVLVADGQATEKKFDQIVRAL